MSQDVEIRYRINDRDEITFVNEAWDRFARDNESVEIAGHGVVGRVLWDFISDTDTRQLYRQIVARVREGRRMRFRLRCDSPSCKRQLEMTIRAAEPGIIEFATRNLQSEPRPPVPLLMRDSPRSAEILRSCAWCNCIEVSPATWKEVEVAVEQLKLFDVGQMPRLSHGICAACFATMTGALNDLNAGKSG